MTSRWVCEQARRSAHRDEATRRTLAAQVVAELAIPAPDWSARQLLLHELGALEGFVLRAPPDLLATADSIDAWRGAAMGGYRLVATTSREVTWRDIGSGVDHLTDNIGSAVGTRPGEHVVGRLVPADGRMMFEARPLRVGPVTAWRVAVQPEDWLETFRAAYDDEMIRTERRAAAAPSLLHDVPREVWRADLAGVPAVPAPTRSPAAGVIALAQRLVAEDRDGTRDADRWAGLGAVLLEARVDAGLLDSLDSAGRSVLDGLADRLSEPARGVCRALAAGSREAA